MSELRCPSHLTAKDHIAGTDGGRKVWRCSACGNKGPWACGWMFHGAVERSVCHRIVVDRVLCVTCAVNGNVRSMNDHDVLEPLREKLRGSK